ncbi:MAG: LytTR family transcriptional regulator [Phycisphaerae bacterium]|nr:LytTR family transcriptional regulator [Saprospiraceae bacterium]
MLTTVPRRLPICAKLSFRKDGSSIAVWSTITLALLRSFSNVVHNSHLINMHQIRQFVRADGGYVVMEDGATVSVARNRKDDFLELFSKF